MWPPIIPPITAWINTPPDSLAQGLPWLHGEKSDEGATDPVTNLPFSKGLCPLIYVGQENITTSAVPTDNGSTVPRVTLMSQTGNAGTIIGPIHSYITAIDASGAESLLSPEGGNLDRGTFGIPHGQRINWGQVAGITSYRIYIFGSGVNDDSSAGFNPLTGTGLGTGICRVLTHDNVTFDGFRAQPYEDFFVQIGSWTDGIAYPGPLSAVPTTPVTSTALWDAYLVFGHPAYQILRIYGSDLGNGDPTATHDRVALDAANRGDILAPGFIWPFSTLYREYVAPDGTTYWLTMVYAKGPLSDDHKNGTVTMACNAIGREDVGDGTGLPLIRAHDVEQSWLENEIIGYWTHGPLASAITYPQWADGTPKVRSSRFAARQAYTIAQIGGNGLEVSWYADTPTLVPNIVEEWDFSTETELGVNGFGQITLGFIDESADPSTWRQINHVTDFFGTVTSAFGVNRENQTRGSCDWDPDAQKFRVGPLTFSSADGYKAYKNRWKPGAILETHIIGRQAHWGWILQRRLNRLKFGEVQVAIPGTIGLMDTDVDDPGILLTTFEGRGISGYDKQPMFLRRRSFDLGTGLVTYSLVDIKQVLYATADNPNVFTGNVGIQFRAGALSLTGYSTVQTASSIVPPAGSIGLTGRVPIVWLGTTALGAGAVGLTGKAPLLVVGAFALATGSVNVTGRTPVVARAIYPTPGSVTLTGKAPVVVVGAFALATGTVSITGRAPTLTAARSISPATGSVNLTASVPLLVVGAFALTTGSVGLVGRAPTLGKTVTPAAGSISLTGRAPLLALHIVPSAGSLGVTGKAPTLV
jgi:hypothetical protein